MTDLNRTPCFKAIVTDPPYGIREPTFKVGTNKDNVIIAEEHLAHHIPQKVGHLILTFISPPYFLLSQPAQ